MRSVAACASPLAAPAISRATHRPGRQRRVRVIGVSRSAGLILAPAGHPGRCWEPDRLLASGDAACPLSNVKLCVFKTLADHKLPALLAAGLCATLNSDDPAYFGGYINDNFIATFEALPQLGVAEAYQLLRNSFEASFAGAADKAGWIAQLDAAFAGAALP